MSRPPSDNQPQLQVSAATFLHAAAKAEIGILIRTDSVDRARVALAKFRRESNDPTIAAIIIQESPVNPETELWLLRPDALETPQAAYIDPSTGIVL